MIHYSHVPSFPLFGNVAVHPFGLLVATGVVAGAWLIHRRAREQGIPREHVDGLIHWAVVPGFIMAHLVEMVFYQTQRLEVEGPLVLLKFWDGISSYGGFLGALLGLIWFYKTTLKKNILVYSDLLIEGLLLGWIFGRLGCTITMDHPGSITEFPLAFEQGGIGRHNLGFYELLLTALVLFPLVEWIRKRRMPAGIITAVVCLIYAPTRFILDLFRATDKVGADTRYFGLTFAHYASIALMVFAVGLLMKLRGSMRVHQAKG